MKLLRDKYRKARGGYSRLLSLSCEHCGAFICSYQKDGAGILKRLYLDRIFPKRNFAKNLTCAKCNSLLGVGYLYKKERREAFRLFAGAVVKKIKKI